MDLQHTKGIMQDILKAGRLGIPPPGPRRPGRACCFGVARISRFLRNAAVGLMLPSPWLLLYAPTAVEISIDLASLGSLLHRTTEHRWSWLAQDGAPLSPAWWEWLVLSTVLA